MPRTETTSYLQHLPSTIEALVAAETATAHGLEPRLAHLVKLRASQINGCAFCVKMHLDEARRDGETDDRLDRLVVWSQVDDFDPRERAALAWTETLTYLGRDADHGRVLQRLQEHFPAPEIAALTASIALINLWNRLQVADHTARKKAT